MTAPGQPMNRDQALKLALVIQRRARADTNHWVGRLQQPAHLVTHGCAAQVIEPHRTTPDPLRTALSREWYVRVFEDQTRKRLGVAEPKIAVTTTETEPVAQCLRDGVAYRIHGPGGSLVLNPDSPRQVPGQNDYTDRTDVGTTVPERPDSWHRDQLEQLARAEDQQREDAENMLVATWDDLTPEQRTAFAAYLHQHQGTMPAASPEVGTRPRKATKAPTCTATDTGNRNPLPGPPGEGLSESGSYVCRVRCARLVSDRARVGRIDR